MGWEVMRKEYHADTENAVVKFCFFCNTTDVAFGPVFYLDCTEDEFYIAWSQVNPKIDPRNANGTHLLGEGIEKMQNHFGMVRSRADIESFMRSVICPTCGALPGQVCTKKYGGSALTHKPRARLARLTREE